MYLLVVDVIFCEKELWPPEVQNAEARSSENALAKHRHKFWIDKPKITKKIIISGTLFAALEPASARLNHF